MLTNKVIILGEDGRSVEHISSNLVVNVGREYVMDMLAGRKPCATISYFSVGNGGVDSANSHIPIAPQPTDIDLVSPIVLGLYPGGGYRKPISAITKVDSTTLLVTLEITASDGGGAIPISEAGLYLYNGSEFILYARTTFPTIWKRTRRVLYWYLFF